MMKFPITVPALRISQPMGEFFAVSLSAELLLEVCFSDRMKAEKTLIGYQLSGTQRDKKDNRLQQSLNILIVKILLFLMLLF